ncbi:ATPase [Sphaerisporangium siamense]|uniref:histidine kinase n=1 Tax=Sphaerisporangium siamense TaxID=795645 RepID=A0A7W7G9D2_9ACTN|nr:sensor histidine kinase [Sphaerisporangium siamense]MBB4700480.1 signal transduction histidine kinase [Sphaerisporangium siamense]GII88357.1 ATPase [Sphaerisporangium siamense]
MGAKVLSSLRRLATTNPFFVDLLLSLLITGIMLLFAAALTASASDPESAQRPMDAAGLALTLLGNLALAWRRRAPLTVLLISCATAAVFHAAGYNAKLNEVAPLVALYTVAGSRLPAVSVPCALVVAAQWWHAAILGPDDMIWPSIVQTSGLIAIAWSFGTSTRMLVERNRRLAELGARLHRELEDRARRAVTEERVRIARELHDVVAHHMSVIVIQAGLARYVFDSDAATARGALSTIADTGTEVMGEMRRLLAVLRVAADDDPDADNYAPAPGLRRLETLAERMRAAGVPVKVSITGTVRPLPPGIDVCAYRIVQESLTNVLKHAGRATTRVHLHYGADLELRITDDGPGASVAPGDDGHGLIGMRERVKLYKGTIKAGPGPAGGFEVVATLPLSVPDTNDQSPTDNSEPKP